MKLDSASLAAASKVDITKFAANLQAMLEGADGNADELDISAEAAFPLAGDGTHDVCVSVRLRCTATREKETGIVAAKADAIDG